MDALITRIPTLVLPWVNINEINHEYAMGLYENVTLPLTGKQYLNIGVTSVRSTQTTDPFGETFSVHEKSGYEVIFTTTATNPFRQAFDIPGDYQITDDKDAEYECIVCGRKCDGKMGVPTLSVPEYRDNGSVVSAIYFTVITCDGECTLNHILEVGMGSSRHNIRYASSESILKTMHALQYPNEPPLEPAPPRSYLRKHGGPLTLEQYKSKSHKYSNNAQFIMLPAKTVFQRMPT